MIVLANEEFATGLRLAGIKDSYNVLNEKHAEEILSKVDVKEFIIATQGVLQMVPRLEEYPNLITFPDRVANFSNIDDLKKIARKAIGAEVDI
jgi:vacuolar-type H+-ATPase subunit F/Vma7